MPEINIRLTRYGEVSDLIVVNDPESVEERAEMILSSIECLIIYALNLGVWPEEIRDTVEGSIDGMEDRGH